MIHSSQVLVVLMTVRGETRSLVEGVRTSRNLAAEVCSESVARIRCACCLFLPRAPRLLDCTTRH
jgi:hypothetical protein